MTTGMNLSLCILWWLPPSPTPLPRIIKSTMKFSFLKLHHDSHLSINTTAKLYAFGRSSLFTCKCFPPSPIRLPGQSISTTAHFLSRYSSHTRTFKYHISTKQKRYRPSLSFPILLQIHTITNTTVKLMNVGNRLLYYPIIFTYPNH